MRARELKNDLFVRKNKQNHEIRFYILNLLLNLPFITFTQQLKIYKIVQKNTKLSISIKNNGIVAGAENTITLKEMEYLQQKYDDRSQFFEQRMIEQIIWNSNLYPSVFNYSTNNGMMPHLGKNYHTQVELGLGRFSGYDIATGMQKAGIGYYSGPEYACLWGY
jgi:hypothetical protein